MEPDLDIRSKKFLTAYPLPTCTQWSIFLLLDQARIEKRCPQYRFYTNSLFDLDLWLKNLVQGH